jgi:hypothetical protein
MTLHTGSFFLRGCLVAGLLLAALVAWVAVVPPYAWLGNELTRIAQRQGLPLAQLRLDRVTPQDVVLRDVILATTPPLMLPSVLVHVDAHLLSEGRIGSVEIEGLMLPLEVQDSTLNARWLEALRPAGETEADAPFPFLHAEALDSLPLDHLRLTDSQLNLSGDVEGTVPFEFELMRTTDGASAPRLQLRMENAILHVAGADLALGQAKATASWQVAPQAWQFSFSLGGLSGSYKGFSRLVNMDMQGSWDADRLSLAGNAKDATGLLELRGEYRLANLTRGQSYRLECPALRFAPGKFQPADLYPAALEYISAVQGTVAAAVQGQTGKNGAWQHKVTLQLENLGGLVHAIPVQGMAGEIQVMAPPWRTDGLQTLHIARIGDASPMEEADVRFSFKKDVLRIPEARARWLGGEVEAAKLRFNGQKVLETALTVRGLPLAALLSVMKQDKVEATGELNGTVPVRYANGKLLLHAGELTASGGRLAYREVETLIPGEGTEMDMVRAALKNLNYETLRLTIGGLGGEEAERVMLYVEGSNPDLLEGKPIHLTVNLTGDLMETLRSSFQAYASPEKLLQSRGDETVVP